MKDLPNDWARRGIDDLYCFTMSPSAFVLVSCLLKDCVAKLTAKNAAGHRDQQKPTVPYEQFLEG